jgi:hypothetical protein
MNAKPSRISDPARFDFAELMRAGRMLHCRIAKILWTLQKRINAPVSIAP